MGKNHLNKPDPVPLDQQTKKNKRRKPGDSFEFSIGNQKSGAVKMTDEIRDRLHENYAKSSRGKKF